jgi:hypothetical protein
LGLAGEKTTNDVYEEYASWKQSIGEEDIKSSRIFHKEFLGKLDFNIMTSRKSQRVAGKPCTLTYFTA